MKNFKLLLLFAFVLTVITGSALLAQQVPPAVIITVPLKLAEMPFGTKGTVDCFIGDESLNPAVNSPAFIGYAGGKQVSLSYPPNTLLGPVDATYGGAPPPASSKLSTRYEIQTPMCLRNGSCFRAQAAFGVDDFGNFQQNLVVPFFPRNTSALGKAGPQAEVTAMKNTTRYICFISMAVNSIAKGVGGELGGNLLVQPGQIKTVKGANGVAAFTPANLLTFGPLPKQ